MHMHIHVHAHAHAHVHVHTHTQHVHAHVNAHAHAHAHVHAHVHAHAHAHAHADAHAHAHAHAHAPLMSGLQQLRHAVQPHRPDEEGPARHGVGSDGGTRRAVVPRGPRGQWLPAPSAGRHADLRCFQVWHHVLCCPRRWRR